MATFEELLDSMSDDERAAMRKKLATDDGDEFRNVDWGSLSDSELAIREAQVFRQVKKDARKRRVADEAEGILKEAGNGDD